MQKHKPMILKARIHKDLMPYRENFAFGMRLFALNLKPAERYTSPDTNPEDLRTFTRTLSLSEGKYFREISILFDATNVELIESSLLASARFVDPDKFITPKTGPCPVLVALSSFQSIGDVR